MAYPVGRRNTDRDASSLLISLNEQVAAIVQGQIRLETGLEKIRHEISDVHRDVRNGREGRRPRENTRNGDGPARPQVEGGTFGDKDDESADDDSDKGNPVAQRTSVSESDVSLPAQEIQYDRDLVVDGTTSQNTSIAPRPSILRRQSGAFRRSENRVSIMTSGSLGLGRLSTLDDVYDDPAASKSSVGATESVASQRADIARLSTGSLSPDERRSVLERISSFSANDDDRVLGVARHQGNRGPSQDSTDSTIAGSLLRQCSPTVTMQSATNSELTGRAVSLRRRSVHFGRATQVEDTFVATATQNLLTSKSLNRTSAVLRTSALQQSPLSPYPAAHDSFKCFRKCLRYMHAEPLHPDARIAVGFEMISSIVLVLEAFLVPYQISFDSPELKDLTLVIASIWTIDLGLGFVTGFYSQEELIMTFGKIARHYLRTFFMINVVVVLSDWISIIFERLLAVGGTRAQLNVLKFLRVCKLLRFIRLAEKLKHSRLYGQFYRIIMRQRRDVAQHVLFFMKVAKIIVGILWINHIGSCLWHGIGMSSSRIWHEQNLSGLADPEIEGSYWLSFYWSITSLASGASFMAPMTMGELIFAICFIFFGLLFGSILVSSLAAQVLNIQMSNQVHEADLRRLKEYLNQHGITGGLYTATVQQANDRALAQQAQVLTEVDVPLIGLLSSFMRSEIAKHRHGPLLMESRTFLRALDTMDTAFIKEVCFKVLTSHVTGPGECIFEPNKEASFAYIVQWGLLEYSKAHPKKDKPMQGSGRQQDVSRGQWIAEVALFCHWAHRGRLEAARPSELLYMDPDAFIAAAHCHADAKDLEDLDQIVSMGSISPRNDHGTSSAAMSTSSRRISASASSFGFGRISARVLSPSPDTPVNDTYQCGISNLLEDYSASFFEAVLQEPFVSDLCTEVPPEIVVRGMPLGSRVAVSHCAFDVLMDQMSWARRVATRHIFQRLISEISTGVCDLSLESGSQHVVRVVTVTVLRLRLPDERVLVQLGTWSRKDGATAKYMLPGTKRRSGELPTEALDRLLRDQLAPLCISRELLFGEASVETPDIDVTRKESKTYKSILKRSTYIREVFSTTHDVDRSGCRLIPLSWRLDSSNLTNFSEDFHFEAFAMPTIMPAFVPMDGRLTNGTATGTATMDMQYAIYAWQLTSSDEIDRDSATNLPDQLLANLNLDVLASVRLDPMDLDMEPLHPQTPSSVVV